MAKRKTYLGSISLANLNHKAINHEGQKGIFIPIGDMNPCIYYTKKEDGSRLFNLDIEVKPTPNSKFGNSFMIKANVGKINRQQYNIPNDKLAEVTPILGNLKEFEFEVKDAPANNGGGAPAEFQGASETAEDW